MDKVSKRYWFIKNKFLIFGENGTLKKNSKNSKIIIRIPNKYYSKDEKVYYIRIKDLIYTVFMNKSKSPANLENGAGLPVWPFFTFRNFAFELEISHNILFFV